MTLQASGAISLADVNVELGFASTAQIGLADTVVRTLFGVASGAISMTSGYSKNNNRTLVSGNLSGSGTLSIPSGVTAVYLSGQGGIGYNDYNPGQAEVTYDPGQPYIQAWYDNPGHAASATTYKWGDAGSPYLWWIFATEAEAVYMYEFIISHHPAPTVGSACAAGASITTATGGVYWDGTYWRFASISYSAVVDQPAVAYQAPSGTYHPGQAYIAPTPAQSYIAPSGGDHYGTSTTATLNGVTRTWAGGYGAVAGTSSSQSLTSTGAGQSMTYAVGGALSYSYYLP